MENKELVKIDIRVTPIDYLNEKSDKYSFWSFVRQVKKHSNNSEYGINEIENIFRENFGIHLKRNLGKFFFSDDLRYMFRGNHIEEEFSNPRLNYVENKLELLSQIFFQVRIQGYSSLNFSLEMSSLSKVVELFNNNFDLFRMFLDAYIPRSFESSVEKFETTGKLDFEIKNIPTELITAFNQDVSKNESNTNVPIVQQKGSSNNDKSQWIWAIVNGSLLVPLFLALIIFYFAFVNLANERKEFQELQKEMMNQSNERLKSYQKIEEQILNKLSQDLNKTVTNPNIANTNKSN